MIEDKNFQISDFLDMFEDTRQASEMTDDIDGLMIEQIKKDVRSERWDSLAYCASFKIAMLVILDFLSVFPKSGEMKGAFINNIIVESVESNDHRKKLKYLYGMIGWCAKLMNIILKSDAIQDNEKIEECYQNAVVKLIPAELLSSRLPDDSSPRNHSQLGPFDDQVDKVIMHIK